MRVDHALGHACPEDLLGGVLVGNHEAEIGVGRQIELAHAEPAQRDHHHLIARRVSRARRGIAGNRLLQRQAIGRADHGVGQVGGARQRLEDRNLAQNALALDAQHGAVEGAAHLAGVLRGFGVAHGRFAGRRGVQLEHQLRMADQLVGEILAVLKQIDHRFHQRRIVVQARQQLRIGKDVLEEMLEAFAAAAQSGARHDGGHARSALIEEAGQDCLAGQAGQPNRLAHFAA